MRIFARKTGNREVSYRWLGEVGSGRLVPAQDHPAALLDDGDTWSEQVDPRMARRTPVLVPTGMLVLSIDYEGREPGKLKHAGYSVAIVSDDPKAPLNWTAAKHLGVRSEDVDHKNKRAGQVSIHRIEIAGVVGEYRCERAS